MYNFSNKIPLKIIFFEDKINGEDLFYYYITCIILFHAPDFGTIIVLNITVGRNFQYLRLLLRN